MKTFKLFLINLLLLGSSLIYAHSGLKHSMPENKSILMEAPKVISLIFNSEVRLIKLILSKVDGHEKENITLDFKPHSKLDLQFIQPLPKLESGNYIVNWVSMGKDAHKVKGEFGFAIDANHTNIPHDSMNHHNTLHTH